LYLIKTFDLVKKIMWSNLNKFSLIALDNIVIGVLSSFLTYLPFNLWLCATSTWPNQTVA